MVMWRQIWMESDWKVENGLEPSDDWIFALRSDLILSMAASENLKTFSLSGGSAFSSPLDETCELSFASLLDEACGSGSGRSSFTRVFRHFVRS